MAREVKTLWKGANRRGYLVMEHYFTKWPSPQLIPSERHTVEFTERELGEGGARWLVWLNLTQAPSARIEKDPLSDRQSRPSIS